MKVKVEDIEIGDLVDLKSCPFNSDNPLAEFELFEVCEVELGPTNPQTMFIGYESIGGLFEYEFGTTLEVEKPAPAGQAS